MANDNLYYWTAIGSKGNRVLLGEVQCGKNGYNIGLSIDGSRDTAKFEVQSLSLETPLKPYTIVWHDNTNTYWIVGKDKVERHLNEVGFVYVHNIQLEGAIELFNARDLTDCGFYQNTYTIDEFVHRLLKLSTFELFDDTSINYNDNLDSDKVIDYVKSFQNYTLLSAIREFFDGYNCAVKLSFNQSNSYKLVSCNLDIVPKTGDINFTPLDMDAYMTDTRGVSSMSKGSYGNCVISNADNVISTKSKVYPTIGCAKLGSTDFYLDPEKDNVVFRLPSKVNSVEWLKIVQNHIYITISYSITTGGGTTHISNIPCGFDPTDLTSLQNALEDAKYRLEHNYSTYVAEYFDEHWAELFNLLATEESRAEIEDTYASATFYDVKDYDLIANKFVSDKIINYFKSYRTNLGHDSVKPYVLANKQLRDNVQEPESVMYWERGSDEIKGFKFFSWHDNWDNSKVIECSTPQHSSIVLFSFSVQRGTSTTYDNIIVRLGTSTTDNDEPLKIDFRNARMKVKYVPMSDIKVKYDNSAIGNDSSLYNQNGKYTDGVALSKLLLSYKDGIESETITRYAQEYSISDMPKVGEIYTKDGIDYVIGNASYDFYQNEERDGEAHKIYAEYTLSKKIATKTTLTSPNTNIRDYGIPQQFNVPRKQVYRDFYELSYTIDSNADTSYYLTLDKALNFTFNIKEYAGHTALIKIEYENPCGGGGEDYDGNEVQPSDEWYFQVDSTYYVMKKQLIEVFDFKDNNIIGYDNQNIVCGWDIRRVFEQIAVGSARIDAVNTPISYVDEKGRFDSVYLSVCNADNLKKVWDIYISEMEEQYTNQGDSSFYNRCVFIPKEVYDESLGYNDYLIQDIGYNKDAIEVPMFEYCCQVDDSDNVVVGDDIFDSNDDDLMYLYEAIIVPHGSINENNWHRHFTPNTLYKSGRYIVLNDQPANDKKACSFTATNTQLSIRLTDSVSFDGSTAIYGNNVNANAWLHNYAGTSRVDLIIVRYTIKKGYTTQGVFLDSGIKANLMFVLKDAKQCPYSSNILVTYINHYKLN